MNALLFSLTAQLGRLLPVVIQDLTDCGENPGLVIDRDNSFLYCLENVPSGGGAKNEAALTQYPIGKETLGLLVDEHK